MTEQLGGVARDVCVHREFSYESPGERILKIGPHLPKLLSNIKWYTFLGHSVVKASVVNMCAL